jgi:hypothetical protein
MLPQIRNQEHLFPVPKFTVSNDDVKNFTNDSKAFTKYSVTAFTVANPEGIFFATWLANSVSLKESPLSRLR